MRMKLSDFCEINPRLTLKKGQLAKKIAMTDLPIFGKSIKSYSIEKYNGGTKFQNGDTLMARITPCLENGKGGYVDILDEGEVGFGSTEYIVFRGKLGVSDSQFLYYFINTHEFRDIAIKSMTGTSGRQRVQTDLIANMEFDFPELDEQRKIATILCYIDEKIKVNNKLNANLEEMGLVLYKKFFIDEHQESWIKGTIVDLGAVVGGSTPSKSKDEYYCESGIPWITPKDLSNNKNKFIERGDIDITELGLQKSSAKVMPAGTVLFSSRAPIGYIAIAKNEVTTNQGFKSVVPNENIGTAYIYYFLKYNLEKIENMASGSTFKEVSGTIMKNIEAIIPDEIVLKEFNMLCMSLFKQQEILEEEKQRLMDLRDILLPKLMSGDIDLSEVEVFV
ncbi:restriction endonuclease subunit S [Clostridium sp. Marseille-P299]|uniref:restriction endonuclease subunit S n=1 Tax=Clostridium sp. Marseille-P299 TaxID=1805477 RepID=UPI000833BEE5|nr:restriction endonuclease subunit S [Clostridium sp. Marseille-P299]